MLRKIMLVLVSVFLLQACASQKMGEGQEIRYGKIISITPVQVSDDSSLGLGAILGGIAGGVLGHQFGGGSGQAFATVAGALAGAFGGAEYEKHRNESQKPCVHVIVQLNNAVAVGITQPVSGLSVGQQVRVDGSGSSARVVPAGAMM